MFSVVFATVDAICMYKQLFLWHGSAQKILVWYFRAPSLGICLNKDKDNMKCGWHTNPFKSCSAEKNAFEYSRYSFKKAIAWKLCFKSYF